MKFDSFLPARPVFPRYCDPCVTHVLDEEERAQRTRQAGLLLDRAGGDGIMRDWSLASYPADHDGETAKQAGLAWLARLDTGEPGRVTGPNLILFGGVGSGKTGLAWSLVRALCEQGVWARILNYRDYLSDVRQRFNEKEYIDERLQQISVLALDDLGAERSTSFARSELATIIERRRGASRPTIVTSNFDLGELGVRLGGGREGQRLVSRLAHRSMQVRFPNLDRRLSERSSHAPAGQ